MPAALSISSLGSASVTGGDVDDNLRLESTAKRTDTMEEIIAAVNGATSISAELEYAPVKRTKPPTLSDIVGLYPIMEVLATQLIDNDLLSLSLVSKEIHALLGQTTSKTYWKLLYRKCRRLECEITTNSRRPCAGTPKRCIRCNIGMCASYSGTIQLLHESAERRIRHVCRNCIIGGRNALLSESPTLFGKHTLNQLTAARKWADENSTVFDPMNYCYLQAAQEKDWTFCPARADLFNIGRQSPWGQSPNPPPNLTQAHAEQLLITAWQTIPRSSTYDIKLDLVREHNISRCVCLQAGLSIPLCADCADIGRCNDFKYIAFARHNSGCCECCTMLVDFPGEKEGEIIPGAIWDPHKDTIPLSGLGCAVNCNDMAEQGSSHVPLNETIQGLCGWCGFRIYQQNEKGKLPVNEYEVQLLRGGMTAPTLTPTPALALALTSTEESTSTSTST